MPRERKKSKDEKRIIPIHFQTFGDMMMNLLTLFILLCSFAKEQRAEFFDKGIGSFIQALESYGLPGLLPGDTNAFNLDTYDDRHHAIMEPGEEDAEDVSSYDKMEEVELENLAGKEETWIPGAVRFKRGSSRLDKSQIPWLKEQLTFLKAGDFEIEVMGHAWEECSNDQFAMKLSLSRAYGVMEYLHEAGGIPFTRMHAVGFGVQHPLAEGKKDPGLNRRVNIKLAKSR